MAKIGQFKKTLKQLRDLQEVLYEKFAIEHQIQHLPKEVSLQEEVVIRMQENFLRLNESYQESKKNILLRKDELNRLQEHRDNYEKEIATVSSQRDYEQIDKAIKDNLDQEQIIHSDIVSLERNLEKLSEEFQSSEKSLQEQEVHLDTLKKNVDADLKQSESVLKSIKLKERELTGDLDEKLVFKFERIIKSKGRAGIVPITKNICNGCHMVLPLQFVNEICQEEEILHCPYCSRILYFDGELEESIEIEETAGLQDLFEDREIDYDDFSDDDYELFLEKDNIGSDSYALWNEKSSENNVDTEDSDMGLDIDEDEDGNTEETAVAEEE